MHTLLRKRPQRGFTLVELIVVILLLSIVGIGVTSFVRFGIEVYQDINGRDRQVSDSRFLIERLTRELREAVPNSVRVNSVNDDDGTCIEFMPIVTSSTYLDLAVLPEATSSTIEVVYIPDQNNTPVTGNNLKLIVFPLTPADVYDSGNEKIFAINSLSAPNSSNLMTITLNNAVNFSQDSPTQRYFIVDGAVMYCQGSDNKILRYSDYPLSVVQAVPNSGGVLMAERQTYATPFKKLSPTLQRNAVVQAKFEFTYTDEVLTLFNEVHIVNVP